MMAPYTTFPPANPRESFWRQSLGAIVLGCATGVTLALITNTTELYDASSIVPVQPTAHHQAVAPTSRSLARGTISDTYFRSGNVRHKSLDTSAQRNSDAAVSERPSGSGSFVAPSFLLASLVLLAVAARWTMRRQVPLQKLEAMAMAACGQCKNHGGCGCDGKKEGQKHDHDHDHAHDGSHDHEHEHEEGHPGEGSHSQRALDKKYMAMALAEGEKGRATAPPNPWVGCVIVKGDTVLGKGYHAKAGQPHAEPTAIANALANGYTDQDLEGSTFYVTLEPCCHYGRTPPCTDALISKKAARVVVAVVDPDERVAGNGVRKLQDAGMEVVVGVLKAEASLSLAPYLHARRTGQAFTGTIPEMTLELVNSE